MTGLLVGANRKKDPGESRGHAVGRSGLTGAAVDLGAALGSKAGLTASGVTGNKRVMRLNPQLLALYRAASTKDKVKGMLNPDILMHGHSSGSALPGLKGKLHLLAPLLGAAAGGAGAYGLAKRKPKSRLQHLRETFKLGADKHARLKVALGINRDDGIMLVMGRLQEGLKQARARKAAASKLAALSLLGVGHGALRSTDPGESRGQAVRHDAGVGLAGDVGGLVGSAAGAAAPVALGALARLPKARGTLGRVLHSIRRGSRGMGIAGGIAGAGIGALLGMQQTMDEPRATRTPQLQLRSPASY